jgi:hypothetical protein
MNNRPSRIVLMLRMFGVIFVLTILISMFWNGLSGINMFPFEAVVGVSLVLTFLFAGVGWVVVTLGGEVLLRDDPNFQKWKQMGGRPYWDSIGWPINTATPIERETGLAEPEYTDFTPPSEWRYQCPVCGSRVQTKIDICWNCSYGRDGDSTAFHQRWGNG